jgi:hypothetical protein
MSNTASTPFPDIEPPEKFKLALYASMKRQQDSHTQRYRLIQFICQQTVFGIIIAVCLYNLSINKENREVWLGLFCTVLGALTSNTIGKLRFKKEDGQVFKDMWNPFQMPQQDNVDGIREKNIPRSFPKRLPQESRI